MRSLPALALLLAARTLAEPPAPGRTLALDEAVRLALANQPLLRQARAGAEAAQARADAALSPLLPQLAGSASYRTAEGSSSAAGPTQWAFGATLSQLVWDFGQAGGRWRAARESAAAQRHGERSTALQVLLSVRTTYFTARAAKDLVAVAAETLQNREAHLRQVQGFVEVGTRPEIDLAQARTDRANAQVQLIGAENGYQTARAQLNQAMGIEGPTDYDVADRTLPAVEGEEKPLEDLLAEALGRRPDIAALDSQVRAQAATAASVRGAFLPTLDLSTALREAGPTLRSTAWGWNANATLTWDIFQGGLTGAQLREAEASLDALSGQVAALRQQVRLEVDQARLAVRAARAAQSAAGEALVNARERLRLAEGRYRTGAGGIIELGDAQLSVTAAGAQRVQAEYNLASARAQLLRALGRPAGPDREPAGP